MAAEEGARENKTKMIVLESEDGLEFAVSKPEAIQSKTIKAEMRFRKQSETPICLDVDGKTLSKVIQYFKRHAGGGEHRDIDDDDPHWDAKFIDVDNETLCDLVNVSYLHPHITMILLYKMNSPSTFANC